jgi:penicillin amidase
MAWTLTQSYDDFKFTNALQKYGKSELENLFPEFYPNSSPILDGTISQISSAPLPQPSMQSILPQFDGILNLKDLPASKKSSSEGTHGSNNWVMDGLRTKHGYPVLANDPHLDLKLPSLWYEIQLTAPGVNVYGVSLPGLPHVIIGFNEDVSWGITNSGNDVIDWYAITFDKSTLSQRYKVDDTWKQPVLKQEVIKVKNESDHVVDVLYTDFGPIAQEYNLEKKNGSTDVIPFAMKWIGSKPTNEFRVFYALNRANSVRDMKTALRTYSVPGQNFMLADKTGSIGYIQAGLFPFRTRHFGRYVLDGSHSSNDWKEFIPFSHLPQSWSPDRGYIASANQQPTFSPSSGFSGGDWESTSYLRGSRINEKLAEFSANGPTETDELVQLQNDVVSLRAKRLLPTLTAWARAERSSPEIEQALDLLESWSFELKKDSTEAVIWSVWWDEFYQSIWEQSFPPPHFVPPSEDRTMELILGNTLGGWPQSPQFIAFNKIPELAIQSLKNALEIINIFKKKAQLKETFPTWGQFRGTSIPHLANLAGFGIEHLLTSGNGDTVNATTYRHGPSWRMVVTWKDALPKAWGIYPGGQSGHVGHKNYNNMVGKWTEGQLDDLLFVRQGRLTKEFISETLLLEVEK